MKRFWTLSVIGGTLASLALSIGAVSAHVGVFPTETTVGVFERYTVRVPSERPSGTTRVEVGIPEGVTFSRVGAKPGWRYELSKDASGRVTSVAWTGGNIGPEEFEEFGFQARNGSEPRKVSWKARQTYADGTVVEWAGAEGAENPAAVTNIKGPDAATQGGAITTTSGGALTSPSGPVVTQEVPTSTQSGTTVSMVLATTALVIALAALALSGLALRRGAGLRPRFEGK